MDVRRYWRESQRRKRAKAKKLGLCGQCTTRKPKAGKKTCEHCLTRRSQAAKAQGE